MISNLTYILTEVVRISSSRINEAASIAGTDGVEITNIDTQPVPTQMVGTHGNFNMLQWLQAIHGAVDTLELNVDNYAIGGLAVGESKEEMLSTTALMNDLIPREKSRYLMGVGTPIDLIECIKKGIDMFDCVIPTRNARNSQLFTSNGKINIRNSCYKNDHSIIDPDSHSHFSQTYTKAYLHHLFRMNEILGLRIATTHNLHFYIYLMKVVRKKILDGSFYGWANEFIEKYTD